jgi:hypothetical protein
MQSKIFQGLKKRPTFNEIVGYLETEQQILKYPDRTATRIKDDPYYTNLDGQGGLSLGEQSKKLQKEQMRQLELNKIYQNMGISANLGRAMGVNRADGNESVGGGSNYESVSAHSVADSNIEDDYEALETFGKEQEALKEDKTKSISGIVAPAVQPSFVDNMTGGASASSGTAKAPRAPAGRSSAAASSISQGDIDDYEARKRVYDVKSDDDLKKDYFNRFGTKTTAKKETIIKQMIEHDYGVFKQKPPTDPNKEHLTRVYQAALARGQGKKSKKRVEDDE